MYFEELWHKITSMSAFSLYYTINFQLRNILQDGLIYWRTAANSFPLQQETQHWGQTVVRINLNHFVLIKMCIFSWKCLDF